MLIGWPHSTSPSKDRDDSHVAAICDPYDVSPLKPVALPASTTIPKVPAWRSQDVATPSPSSSVTSLGGGSGSPVPTMGDQNATQPTAGKLRVSESALYHRMYRVFHPRNGNKKVSDAMIKQWDKGGKSRKNLQQVFQACGYNPDRCWAKKQMKQTYPRFILQIPGSIFSHRIVNYIYIVYIYIIRSGG